MSFDATNYSVAAKGVVLNRGSTYAARDVVWNELYSCLILVGSNSGWEAGNALASRADDRTEQQNWMWLLIIKHVKTLKLCTLTKGTYM